jgi:competence protein ComFC
MKRQYNAGDKRLNNKADRRRHSKADERLYNAGGKRRHGKADRGLYNAWDFIYDIFFPNRCPGCGAFIPWNSSFCVQCAENLEDLAIYDAALYGADGGCNDVVSGTACPRENTGKTDDVYDKLLAVFEYDGVAVSALYAMKFVGDRNFPKLCAFYLADEIGDYGVNFDALVAVPMGKKRRRKRGYNQAEVFARYISRFTDIPVINGIIERVGEIEQHKLTASERRVNAEAAYRLIKQPPERAPVIMGKRILLVDDVCTTGATLTACAKLLFSAGAKSVSAAVATRVTRV